MQQHEVENERREQDEANANIAFEAFKSDAIERVKDCFNFNQDLVDLINELDLDFDETESLSNEQINEIIFAAVGSILIKKRLL